LFLTIFEYQKSLFLTLEIISKLETEEIEDIASHLNQKVKTLCKSLIFFIFEVVCFSVIISKSSLLIQNQSSIISMFFIHHSKIFIFIFVAQASIEFSTNSLTTDIGLSTTSHAAI
jgi:hypothetical protein